MKKKYSLLITLAITFLVVVVLSWIIPVGGYYYGTFELADPKFDPIGIFEIFKFPILSFGYILLFGMLFLTIGGFYGVLNKTGAYTALLEKITKKFKKKPKAFAILTILLFALASSILGSSNYLFLFVPLFVSALLLLGYNKIGALLATVGAILVGIIGSTYSFEVSGYVNHYLSLGTNANIVIKIGLLVASTVLLTFFVLKNYTKEKNTKKDEKEETKKEISIPLYEENKVEGKSATPLIVILIFSAILILVGTFSWEDVFGITFFKDSYTALMKVEIFGYPIVSNILGGFSQIGYWSSQDVNVVIILMSLLVGWIYSIRLKDIVDSFIHGAKKMLPTFIYVTLAMTVLGIMMNATNGNFINYTIMDFLFNLTDKFNALSYGLATFANSFFVSYFPYLSGDMGQIGQLVYTDATTYPLMAIILQSVYGVAMFVLPTSMLLIAGLSYLQISFKEWIKNTWKLILGLLGIVVLMIGLATLFL